MTGRAGSSISTCWRRNRFNRFALNLGIGYDYPYHNNILSDVYLHFAYPILVDLPGTSIGVEGLPEASASRTSRRSSSSAARRRGAGSSSSSGCGPSATISTRSDARLTDRRRDRGEARALLPRQRRVPAAGNSGDHRPHLPHPRRGGRRRGRLRFLADRVRGGEEAGRTIEINLHAKGLDEHVLGAARDTGMPVIVAPKYLAEHMGLPYHPSAIREREYPPAEAVTGREQLSTGSRRFTRQSYGDLPAARPRLGRDVPHLAGHAARSELGRSGLRRGLWPHRMSSAMPTASSGWSP